MYLKVSSFLIQIKLHNNELLKNVSTSGKSNTDEHTHTAQYFLVYMKQVQGEGHNASNLATRLK